MATKLGSLAQFFDPGLELSGVPPIDDKAYRVPLPSAELGLWCRTVASAGAAVHQAVDEAQIAAARQRFAELPDMPVQDLTRALLGPVYDEMVADGVADAHIQFCASTTYAWVLGGCGEQGEQFARDYWESGGHPEARGPRSARRAAARAKTTTSTAAARTTRKAGSGSGTRSRTTSSVSARPRRSTGSTS